MKTKTKKDFNVKLTPLFTLTIISVVIASVAITMFTTIPKANQLIKEQTLNYMKEMAVTCKYELKGLNKSCADSSYEEINNLFGDTKCTGMPGSYIYIVSNDGTMLYHPSQDKIGNPVENSCVKGIVADLQAGKTPKDDAISYEYKNAIKYAGYIITDDQEILIVTADEKEALQSANSIVTRGVLVSLFVVFAFAFYGFFVSKIIAKPLKETITVINELSQGNINNDISITSFVSETKELIGAASILQNNLNNIVNEIKTASNDLSSAVSSNNSLCSTSADSASQISTAVDELSVAAQSMAESVQVLNENIIDIGSGVSTIDEAVTMLNESSKTMRTISDTAKEDINEVIKSSEKSAEATENIAAHMKDLASAINEISEATDLINNISSQTKLLSLNASIEAARAGEQGRGFAVVAQEIGTLAAQSNEGADKINEISKNILTLSDVSMKLTEDIKLIIADEQKKVQKTQESFTQLKDEIGVSVSNINEISNKTKSLDKAKDIAISAVSDLSAISEENAASNQEVTANVTSLSSNIREIADKTNHMDNMANTLSEAISAFKN